MTTQLPGYQGYIPRYERDYIPPYEAPAKKYGYRVPHDDDSTSHANRYLSTTALTHSQKSAFVSENFGGTLPPKSTHGLNHKPWGMDPFADRDPPYPARTFNPDGTIRPSTDTDNTQNVQAQSSNVASTVPSDEFFVLTGPKATSYVTTYSSSFQGWAAAQRNASAFRESRHYMMRNPNYARIHENQYAIPDTSATRFSSVNRSDFLNPIAVIEAGIVKEANATAQTQVALLKEARQRRARVVRPGIKNVTTLPPINSAGNDSNSSTSVDTSASALATMDLTRPETVLEASAQTKSAAFKRVHLMAGESEAKNVAEIQSAQSLDPAALAVSTRARLWLGPETKDDFNSGGRVHAYPGTLPGFSGYLPRHTMVATSANDTTKPQEIAVADGITHVLPELDQSAATVAAKRAGLLVYPGSGTGLAPRRAKVRQGLVPGGVRVSGGQANSIISTSALASQSIPGVRSAAAAAQSDIQEGVTVPTSTTLPGAITLDTALPGYTGHIPRTDINHYRAQSSKGTSADPHNLHGYMHNVTNSSLSNIGFASANKNSNRI